MAFLSRLTSGLTKTSDRLGQGITQIFTHSKLDDAALERLEELLIEADLGVSVAAELVEALRDKRFDKEVTGEDVKKAMAKEIAKILEPVAKPLILDFEHKPVVIVMVGVNGNGKTTTIGKLAAQFKAQGKSVVLAAADTFRAAASEQLQVWGERNQIPVVIGPAESDPASVAFRAYEKAKAEGADILLVDTAGRLQNKANLMAELQKIIKALGKLDASAPHHVIQVLDATTGRNAISQVQAFRDVAKATGLIVTKLDGTAKGGVVVALAKQFALPIYAIGIGEGIEDLGDFQAIDFSNKLLNV